MRRERQEGEKEQQRPFANMATNFDEIRGQHQSNNLKRCVRDAGSTIQLTVAPMTVQSGAYGGE